MYNKTVCAQGQRDQEIVIYVTEYTLYIPWLKPIKGNQMILV